MPTITFSLEDTFYRVLEEIGKKVGVSPHRVAKEIVVNYLRSLMLDTYVAHKAGNFMQNINMEHKYPDIYVAHKYPDTYAEHKVQTYSSDINIANKAEQDPSDDELSKKLEVLDKKLDVLVKELRKQQDLIVAYTGKIDQVLQRLSQVIEVVESRDEKLNKVVALLQQLVEALRQGSAKVSEEQKVSGKSAKREKVDKCERLKEQLVIFESDVARKGTVKDRDRFFASLERDCGAIIIEGVRERIAVEGGFWLKFLEKLSKIDTSNEEKIKSLLDPLEFRLFKALEESALIAFNANERKWKLIADTTKSSSTASEKSEKQSKRRGEEDESWLLQYAPQPEET